MKKLIYIANARIPTEKAHGMAVMKMCEAFAKSGVEVELVVPRRFNDIKEDPFIYYGVDKNFSIKKLFVIDLMPWLGKAGFFLEAVFFAEMAFWYGLFSKADIIYGRDELSLSYLSLFKKNVVWEAHMVKAGWLVRGLLKRCNKLVVISFGLKEYYVSLGIPEEKVLVAPSGVDIEVFERIKDTKKQLRKKLNLPWDKKIVAYVGKRKSMEEDKGVEELETVFGQLSNENPNIYPLIVSDVSPKEAPLYMEAVDVLIMNYPNTGHYAKYMSPLKLFEYMASGTPIITSDIPSIREILDDSMAHFFKPDDIESLKEAIVGALNSSEVGKDNLEKVKEYSWGRRAQNVVLFIDKTI